MRLVLVLVFAAMVIQLVNVQEFSHQRYASLSVSELTQTVAVPAVRGGVYDRNGEVLAETVTKQTVVADPLLIDHPATIADALAPVLGIPNAQLRAELTEHSGFVYLAHRVSDAVAAKVTSLDLTGINLVPEAQRVLPDGQLASPVVGSVNWEGSGASGLEYQYQSLLAGKAGSESLLQAPDGVTIPGNADSSVAAEPGTGVELTIDESIQYVAEQALGAEIAASPRLQRYGGGDGCEDGRHPGHGRPAGHVRFGHHRSDVGADRVPGTGRFDHHLRSRPGLPGRQPPRRGGGGPRRTPR